jgi:hypothetical protein
MTEIINAVLIDLSGITAREFPNLDVWFSQFQDVILRAMVALNNVYGKWGMAVVTRAAEIATALGTVLQILGVDLTAIIPPPPNFEALLGAFLVALMLAAEKIIPWLRDLTATYSGPVMTGAAEAADALMAIIGVLSLSSVLADLSNPENAISSTITTLVSGVLAALTSATDLLVPGLLAIDAQWGEALDTVVSIAQKMASVFGGVNDAQKAALEFSTGGDLDLTVFTRKIATLNAATGAAVAGLGQPVAGGGAGTAGAGAMPTSLTVNIYNGQGTLTQTYSQKFNDAGQIDIRLGEAMSAG